MKIVPILAAAAAVVAVPSVAASPGEEAAAAKPGQAQIPFAASRGIRSFHAESDETVYLEDRRGRWYRAELAGTCLGLRWALAIGYDTRGGASFDRFSAILVDGQRCPLVSLTRSEKPERRRGKKPAA